MEGPAHCDFQMVVGKKKLHPKQKMLMVDRDGAGWISMLSIVFTVLQSSFLSVIGTAAGPAVN
jgi:hypothetical protein